MFTQWNFLLAEIWVLLALAALVGLIAGYLIFGGRAEPLMDMDETRRLRAELEREKARNRDGLDDVPAMQGGGYVRPTPPPPAPKQTVLTGAGPVPKFEPLGDAGKPAGLDGPRDGLADDLTKIKGVGEKLQTLCNELGFWHYDQIANWSAEEIAWVDDNLEGFKGRVSRDEWVEQARALAPSPAFVRRRD